MVLTNRQAKKVRDDIGLILKDLLDRKSDEYTQRDIAKICGISEARLSEYCGAKRPITEESLVSLIWHGFISIDDIVGGLQLTGDKKQYIKELVIKDQELRHLISECTAKKIDVKSLLRAAIGQPSDKD